MISMPSNISRSSSAIRAMQPAAQTMSNGDAANGILQAKLLGSGTADVLAAAISLHNVKLAANSLASVDTVAQLT